MKNETPGHLDSVQNVAAEVEHHRGTVLEEEEEEEEEKRTRQIRHHRSRQA
jgi:hypothetical protein